VIRCARAAIPVFDNRDGMCYTAVRKRIEAKGCDQE
jgi:hypothetical protein